MAARIGIIALQHESNTFARTPTRFEHFEQDLLLSGEAVREHMAGGHHEVAGFFEGINDAGMRAVPIFAARAVPGGTMASDCLDRLVSVMLDALETAGPLDGLLVAPHGAAVSDQHASADGYWLGKLRQKVGSQLPIVATVDVHANVSPTMLEACQAIIAYRTNPHVDQRERGLEAAALLARTLRNHLHPRVAISRPPMVINIERQSTAETPCADWLAQAQAVRAEPGVLAVSMVLGFPYADVPDMGPCVVVSSESQVDPQPLADRLARYAWDRRREFAGRLIEIDQALRSAVDKPRPVLLLDMGDNVGGGSPGDSTHILHALRRYDVTGVLTTIYDPVSVALSGTAGAGNRTRLQIGGKGDPACGPPFDSAVQVLGLFDGKFNEAQVRHGGMTSFDMGRTALVRTDDGQTVMLTSRRLFPVSLGQWTAFGINPAEFQFIVAKGVHAPVAAYRDVCPCIIRVNTPGITSADVFSFDFGRRPRPMFPFEPDTAW